MLRRGLHTPARSLRSVLILAPLFVILFLIFIFLKKKIISDSSENIYLLLKSNGFNDVLSKFATAQAAHETAVMGIPFMSSVYKNNNNAFGMKYAGQIYAQGEKNGYANYINVNNSVKDFVNWYSRHRGSIFSLPLYIGSVESFVRFLKNNNYFEAPESEYLSGVNYFYKQLFA